MQAEAFDPHAPLGTRRAVIRHASDGIEMVELGWGLKPRDEDGRPFRFVRAEGRRFPTHRCLIPASEFQVTRAGRHYRVALADRDWFYLAGIWQPAEGTRTQRSQRLPRARAVIEAVDHARGTVTLRLSGGRERVFRPEKLHTRPTESLVQLYDAKTLQLHERDRIRWTANDRDRGLFNADQARVVLIDVKRVKIETSQGTIIALPRDDPMLQRLDLAYALNAHMAQGLTSDRGIAVMETRDTKLVNQQTFLVTVTRLRDALTLVVDRANKLEGQLSRNAGGKSSALETTGSVRDGRPAPKEPSRRDDVRVPPEKSVDANQGRSKPYEIGI